MKLLDSSCIILFLDLIPQFKCIDLLYGSGEKLGTTFSVKKEYEIKVKRMHDPNFPDLKEYLEDKKIELILNDCHTIEEEIRGKWPWLGDGEISIMALGCLFKNIVNYICVLDDKKARKAAKELGLNITGSIGLLIKLKEMGILNETERKQIINAINQSVFKISEELLWGLK